MPFLAKDIDLLERVQRCATKCLHSLSSLSYKEQLAWEDLILTPFFVDDKEVT